MPASKTQSGGKIPDGFTSPFLRVQQVERNDDALACIATLTRRTLEEVTKLAVQLGYPPHGPAFVDQDLIVRVLHNLGLTASDYRDFVSLDTMPYVAILCLDYQPITEMTRHVVFHHVKGTDAYQSFSYVIDPANWLEPKYYMTSDFSHLKLDPAWFIEVTNQVPPGKKAK